VNVGNAGRKIWYSANKLRIVGWQVAHGKIPSNFAAEMLEEAKRSPDVNQTLIRTNPLVPLGIQPSPGRDQFYKVGFYVFLFRI
jgi:hypothetical protein